MHRWFLFLSLGTRIYAAHIELKFVTTKSSADALAYNLIQIYFAWLIIRVECIEEESHSIYQTQSLSSQAYDEEKQELQPEKNLEPIVKVKMYKRSEVLHQMKSRLKHSSSQESYVGSLFAPGKIRRDRSQTRKVMTELMDETHNDSVKKGRVKMPVMQGPYNFEKSREVPMQTLITKIKERRQVNSRHRQKDIAKREAFNVQHFPKPDGGFSFQQDSRFKKLVFIQPDRSSKHRGIIVVDRKNAHGLRPMPDIKGRSKEKTLEMSLSKKQPDFNLTPNRWQIQRNPNRPWDHQVPNYKLERQRWMKVEEHSFASETRLLNGPPPLPSIKRERKDSRGNTNAVYGVTTASGLAQEQANETADYRMRRGPRPPVLIGGTTSGENVTGSIAVSGKEQERITDFVSSNNQSDFHVPSNQSQAERQIVAGIDSITTDSNGLNLNRKTSISTRNNKMKLRAITKGDDVKSAREEMANVKETFSSQGELFQTNFDKKSKIREKSSAEDSTNPEITNQTNIEGNKKVGRTKDFKTDSRQPTFNSSTSGTGVSDSSTMTSKNSNLEKGNENKGHRQQRTKTSDSMETTPNHNGIYGVDWASQTGGSWKTKKGRKNSNAMSASMKDKGDDDPEAVLKVPMITTTCATPEPLLLPAKN